MTIEERNEAIAEIISQLSETERVSYLTQYFNMMDNNYISYYLGYGTEAEFDKHKDNVRKTGETA